MGKMVTAGKKGVRQKNSSARAPAPGDEHRVTRDKLAGFLDMPQEALCDWPRVTVVGNKQLVLENHRGVQAYEETKLLVFVTLGLIEITGRGLHLSVIRPDALALEGEIENIRFLVRTGG